MKKKNHIHVSLRLNQNEHEMLKKNADLKKLSINNYLLDLIKIDAGVEPDNPLTEKMQQLLRAEIRMSNRELFRLIYVVLELSVDILSSHCHIRPTEEAVKYARNIVDQKFYEADATVRLQGI